MARIRKPFPKYEKVEIIDAGSEGKAVARVDNRVIFVPFVVPGDVVDIQVVRKKKSFFEGRAEKFHTYSDKRVEPKCKHFGLCGGCKWQNMDYAAQLHSKQRPVTDNLERIGGLELPEVMPIIASDNIYHYRNKLEYTFSNRRWFVEKPDPDNPDQKNRNGLGFHLPGMFDRILDIDTCYLQADPSNAIRLATRDFALEKELVIPVVSAFESHTGKGARGQVNDHGVLVGSEAYLSESGISVPHIEWMNDATSLFHIGVDGAHVGTIQVGDPLRASSKDAIAAMQIDNLRVVMLTGDDAQAADRIAKAVGLAEVHAGLLPRDKVSAIKELQERGDLVAMVGDGINDAPALAQADIGIAVRSGTDIAMESSDVTLMSNDLSILKTAVLLSKLTMRTIRQNLFFAFIYNVSCIPLAAGLLFPAFGWQLSPVIASAAMALSSVSVVTNSLRLKAARL